MRFHLEIHPALLSEELKKELASMPKGLLHLEAGIQSLHEEVLTVSRRAGKLADALEVCVTSAHWTTWKRTPI